MVTYSTRDIPRKAKVSYWNDKLTDVFTPLETCPRDSSEFEAEIQCVSIGRLQMANVVSSEANIHHRVNYAARSNERRFLVQMQLSGPMQMCQDGKETLLKEGDFTLCDTSQPFTINLGAAGCTTLVLIVPADDLKRHFRHRNRLSAPSCRDGTGFRRSPRTSSAICGSRPMAGGSTSRWENESPTLSSRCWPPLGW